MFKKIVVKPASKSMQGRFLTMGKEYEVVFMDIARDMQRVVIVNDQNKLMPLDFHEVDVFAVGDAIPSIPITVPNIEIAEDAYAELKKEIATLKQRLTNLAKKG